MASVSIDKRENGRYRVRWREYAGANQKSQTFDRKRDADEFATKIKHDLNRGAYVDPNAGRETVRDYYLRWSAWQTWRPGTRSRIEHIFAKYVLEAMGSRPIGSVRRSDVQA